MVDIKFCVCLFSYPVRQLSLKFVCLGGNVFASSLSSEWRVLRSVAHLILIRHVLIEEGYFQNSDYSEDRRMKENTREGQKRSSEIYSPLKCINS